MTDRLAPSTPCRTVAWAAAACLILSAARTAPAQAPVSDKPKADHPFDKNVKVTFHGDEMIVESDGIPTHPTATFPNPTNSNRIRKQEYRFQIPRHPRKAEQPTPTPFGPIGVAVNGIPFYNPYNAQGRDAVLGPNAEVFDSCCGHPDPMGRYHYHKYPVCLKTPFQEVEGQHSPLLGLMFDGFALYGPNGDGGTPPADLDLCNGHEDGQRGYHYHATEKFPYLIASYQGKPTASNIDRPRFAGRNGPFEGMPGPPPPPNIMMALDTDRDGELSADEIKAAPATLMTLDKNKDGKLSGDELRPPHPPMPREDAPPPRRDEAPNQVPFAPFSDFLLHDMGSLGNGIAQGDALTREMRTAPLWGLRFQANFLLHDGRANSIDAAILQHDGQAKGAKNSYMQLNPNQKSQLMAFLNSL